MIEHQGTSLADTRLDIRTELELFWRWHYADAEASGLQGNWPEAPPGRLPDAPSWRPPPREVGLRCGPVYVPAQTRAYPDYDVDLRGMRAYHRMRRIDAALRATPTEAVSILRLALADPPDPALLLLCPLGARGPALCNLVPLTGVALAAWRASRSTKALRPWLVRQAARAFTGHGDTRLRQTLTLGASVLLARAGGEYGRVRRRLGP